MHRNGRLPVGTAPRSQVWVIALLLVTGSFALGFGASQWSLASWYSAQVAEVRRGYDEATVQRDMRLNKLAKSATEAAVKVEGAAGKATEAAEVASKAADKVNEAVERQTP
ncbi:lipoprotein [Pseudomonas amygdali pv. lachrymans]|nr:lipoprotein [Pseudomonas amygdali pv. lachrymans]